MNILFVCSNWKVFGAETVTLRLLKSLKERGHGLHVVDSTLSDGDFSRRLADLGIPETSLPMGMLSTQMTWYALNGTRWSLVRLPSVWSGFGKLLKEFSPDVVVYGSSRLCTLLLPFLKSRPSVLLMHENEHPSAARKFITRSIARRLKALVAVSEFTARHLRGMGVPPGKIHVIKNARHELAEIKSLARPVTVGAGELEIGLVGQVSPHKGHDVLLEALAMLRARNITVSVKIFGGGSPEYIAQLDRQLREKNLAERWHWCGYENNLDRIFGELDVCAVPSCLDESFGMTAVEASAYGLPVVASRRGGLPEIVEDGVTGFLVESG
jgi:glycosyltransferase involved in cell wall biosynthesis